MVYHHLRILFGLVFAHSLWGRSVWATSWLQTCFSSFIVSLHHSPAVFGWQSFSHPEHFLILLRSASWIKSDSRPTVSVSDPTSCASSTGCSVVVIFVSSAHQLVTVIPVFWGELKALRLPEVKARWWLTVTGSLVSSGQTLMGFSSVSWPPCASTLPGLALPLQTPQHGTGLAQRWLRDTQEHNRLLMASRTLAVWGCGLVSF